MKRVSLMEKILVIVHYHDSKYLHTDRENQDHPDLIKLF